MTGQLTEDYSMDIRKVIKSRLRKLKKSGYSLAQDVGISKQAMSAYLRGRNDMNATTLGKVLDVLGLEVKAKK